MEYEYSGDAHKRLLESYATDSEQYPTRDCPKFPRRRFHCEELDVLKRIFFPRCWNATELIDDADAVKQELSELGSLFYRGMCPYNSYPKPIITAVLDKLPDIRELLKKDVEAAYKGDPAAKSYVEIVRAYPGFQAIMAQRAAHEIYEQGIPVYARELTEAAKIESGIDIHPGAEIGEYFFIDHGTGVVVGETTTIGHWCRIYQDVTLGALHFEESENDEHALKKGYKRHPDIGDSVVIGAGSKVLGAITVGDNVSIGANSWVTEDVPDNTRVFISEHPRQERKNKGAPQD